MIANYVKPFYDSHKITLIYLNKQICSQKHRSFSCSCRRFVEGEETPLKLIAENFSSKRTKKLQFLFGEEVAEGGEGVVEDHSGAGVAHHCADSGFHFGPITVDRTFATSSLVVAKLAMCQTRLRIFKQFRTVSTYFPVALLVTAIELYHLLDGPLLSFNPCHLLKPQFTSFLPSIHILPYAIFFVAY